MADAPVPNTPEKPATAAAPPSDAERGSVTIDANQLFEVQTAVYESIGEAAAEIKERVTSARTGEVLPRHDAKHAKWLIVFLPCPPALYLEARDLFAQQTQNLTASFTSAAERAEAALQALEPPAEQRAEVGLESATPQSTISTAISAAGNLLGLLREDVTYSGRKVTSDPIALPLALAHQWEDIDSIEFIDPRFFPLRAGWFERSWTTHVLAPLNEVVAARERAFRAIHQLSTAVYQLSEKDPRFRSARFSADFARDHFEQPEQIFIAMQGRLQASSESTGLSWLEQIRMGAAIEAAAQHPETYFLFAKVLEAGGSYRTVKSLWRMLFSGDGAYYSGGAIVAFALCDHRGRWVRADVLRQSTPFRPIFSWFRRISHWLGHL